MTQVSNKQLKEQLDTIEQKINTLPTETHNSIDRLEGFEDIFSEIMVGFALALLIAVWLAPTIFFNWDSAEKIKATDLAVRFNTGETAPPGAWQFQENNNEDLTNPDKVQIFKKKGPPDLMGICDWDSAIFLFLALWIVKYLHEGSVMKFHNSHRNNNLSLNKVGNIFMFISKALFLIFLYILIIEVYLKNSGKFTGTNSTEIVSLALFVFFGYILPDFILFFSRDKLELSTNGKNIFKILCCLVKYPFEALPNDPMLRAIYIWCRVDISVMAISLLAFVISRLVQGDNDLLKQGIILIIIGVNLFDWGFNHKFFWDKRN